MVLRQVWPWPRLTRQSMMVNAITTNEATRATVTHVYKSAATYNVTARALPGCVGFHPSRFESSTTIRE